VFRLDIDPVGSHLIVASIISVGCLKWRRLFLLADGVKVEKCTRLCPSRVRKGFVLLKETI